MSEKNALAWSGALKCWISKRVTGTWVWGDWNIGMGRLEHRLGGDEEGNWNNGMGRLEYRLGGDWNIGWGKTRHNSQSTGVEDVWQRQW